MFGIPLPWIIIGVMVSLFGTYRGGYHFGWSDRNAEMQIAIAKKNEEARILEKNMASKLSDQESKLRKAQDEIAKKKSAMHELARTGRLRLPTASCPQTSANPATSAGNSTDASELERKTIAALIDIAADGDKAISKLNSCVAAYNEVRNLVNGQ